MTGLCVEKRGKGVNCIQNYRFHRVGNARIETFEVRGERSSGTNFLQAMMREFTSLEERATGWKHGFGINIPLPESHLVLISVRHWEGWLKSMFRKPWHATKEMHLLEFSDFLRTPWNSIYLQSPKKNNSGQFLQADRHPITGTPHENILAMRNLKNEFFLGFFNRNANVILVQTEWLTENGAVFLDLLHEAFGIVETSLYKPITTKFANHYNQFPKLKRPKLPDEIREKDMTFIRSILDSRLEKMIGYEI